ncbi:MAG: hypothetical protein E7612_03465 [Ruminococcaceae bacterium]|nr:hypothetical protein [Oscillospiraceae bacterium]
MKITVQSDKYGTIEYIENIWIGKTTLSINGEQLKKKKKNLFISENDNFQCRIKGGYLQGAILIIGEDVIEITPRPRLYEVVLSLLIAITTIIWGNSVTLCSIIPIIGGALGGGLSGVCAFFCLFFMKRTKGILKKLAVWLVSFFVTFLLCFYLAYIFLSIIY